MVKLTAKQVEAFAMADRLRIVVCTDPAKWPKLYRLQIDDEPESDYEGCVFYNHDLRSICGSVDDPVNPGELDLNPRFYACDWGEPRTFNRSDMYGSGFAQLLKDATLVEVVD